MERFRNLSAMSPERDVAGITRMEVIEDSADAFTQHSDAHAIAKYEGDLKTKHRDRIHTFYRYFIDICR